MPDMPERASRYGMHVTFTAQSGSADELEAILLEAAAGLADDPDCLLYIVSRSASDPDTVYVTEAWASSEAHAASLEDERVRALIERAMPLMARPPEATTLAPRGGKGL
jgi:quinol monooxygenase YgiN